MGGFLKAVVGGEGEGTVEGVGAMDAGHAVFAVFGVGFAAVFAVVAVGDVVDELAIAEISIQIRVEVVVAGALGGGDVVEEGEEGCGALGGEDVGDEAGGEAVGVTLIADAVDLGGAGVEPSDAGAGIR